LSQAGGNLNVLALLLLIRMNMPCLLVLHVQ
jgi:hypothetical protein